MNKIIAQNSKGDGLLQMKQGPEQENKKSKKQKNEELCNFIKNAFVADGTVSMVQSDKPFQTNLWFLVETSNRGKFAVAMKQITK